MLLVCLNEQRISSLDFYNCRGGPQVIEHVSCKVSFYMDMSKYRYWMRVSSLKASRRPSFSNALLRCLNQLILSLVASLSTFMNLYNTISMVGKQGFITNVMNLNKATSILCPFLLSHIFLATNCQNLKLKSDIIRSYLYKTSARNFGNNIQNIYIYICVINFQVICYQKRRFFFVCHIPFCTKSLLYKYNHTHSTQRTHHGGSLSKFGIHEQ